jgi:hypothetical protein
MSGFKAIMEQSRKTGVRRRLVTRCQSALKVAVLPLLMCVSVNTLSGCASSQQASILDGETMAIVAKNQSAGAGDVKSIGNNFRTASKVGATGGAIASLLFWPVCPGCVVLPAFVGATAGGLVGASTDALRMFPPKTSEQLTAVVIRTLDRRDFHTELHNGLIEAVPPAHQIAVAAADVIVHAELNPIELIEKNKSMLALRMTATLIVDWQTADRNPSIQSKRYQYTTIEMPMDYWIRDGGATFDSGLSDCLNGLVEMMGWDLAPDRR